MKLELCYDSCFAGEKATCKSLSGWVVYLNNRPFIWSSRKQTSNETSTAEAKYISMS